MKLIGFILLPFTFLYSMAIRLRNHLFNIGYTRTIAFEPIVISVGNLVAGGAGKTPMVEYLIRLLSGRQTAVLSRGYGRKTKGIRFVSEAENSETVGDEPMQIWRKYEDTVVCVGEERVLAIPTILQEYPESSIILLDDAYQHRFVARDVNILLTSYPKPFFLDFLLPSGRLREPRKEASRADIVVVTKCPDSLDPNDEKFFRERIGHYSTIRPDVFFTRVKYSTPVSSLDSALPAGSDVVGFAGIANSDDFVNHLTENYNLQNFKSYADHHSFTEKELEELRNLAEGNSAKLVTTEKDYARIRHLLADTEVFYIPIEMEFLKDGKQFDSLIFNAVASKDNR